MSGRRAVYRPGGWYFDAFCVLMGGRFANYRAMRLRRRSGKARRGLTSREAQP